jgi:hypothetical protein
MPLFEDRCASFIVRVWCERGDSETRSVPVWRGSIEHVPSGERGFFQELDAVIAFMKPHLIALGIEAPDRFWERMDDAAAAPPVASAAPALLAHRSVSPVPAATRPPPSKATRRRR